MQNEDQVIKKEIYVTASEERLAEAAKMNGVLQAEIDEQEKDFDEIEKKFKEQKRAHDESIKQKSAKQAEINREVNTGKVKIYDDTLMRKNFEANTIEFLWPAVGEGEKEVVESRAMTEDERQTEMFAHAEAIPEGGQEMEAE